LTGSRDKEPLLKLNQLGRRTFADLREDRVVEPDGVVLRAEILERGEVYRSIRLNVPDLEMA
jgi:hypothetical protein